ncbi:MAG: tetratricopeptide repeat protein [Bacteroidales bacterium]|nr:tetratricopeptide repeat protein [Bacteroidales bacterium]
METLKRMLLVIIAACGISISNAQEDQQLLDAFSKSYQMEQEGNFTGAVASLQSVYSADSYEINLRIGWLLYLKGSLTESMEYYNKAINLKPYAIEPRFGIAYPAYDYGNHALVIEQYQKILETCPNNTLAMYRLGAVYYYDQRYAEAEKQFEKVVNLFPFDYDSLLMLAWTKYQLKQYREALVLFNKALLYDPSSESAKEGIGLIR